MAKYAPHLEKCMGKGRVRAARTRKPIDNGFPMIRYCALHCSALISFLSVCRWEESFPEDTSTETNTGAGSGAGYSTADTAYGSDDGIFSDGLPKRRGRKRKVPVNPPPPKVCCVC